MTFSQGKTRSSLQSRDLIFYCLWWGSSFSQNFGNIGQIPGFYRTHFVFSNAVWVSASGVFRNVYATFVITRWAGDSSEGFSAGLRPYCSRTLRSTPPTSSDVGQTRPLRPRYSSSVLRRPTAQGPGPGAGGAPGGDPVPWYDPGWLWGLVPEPDSEGDVGSDVDQSIL